MTSIARLAPYPPTQARRQIPASQLASLNAAIASTLPVVLSLPQAKYDVESSRVYVQTYARDASCEVLQALIWESQGGSTTKSKDEGLISKYTVLLAKKLAGDLDLQTLLDLTIGYSVDKGNKQHLKAVLNAASEAGNSTHDAIARDLVPALTLLLSPHSESNRAQGLYALRKTAHCILSFLTASPPSFIRHFAHSKPFVLALAQAYDTSLASVATSYGGINVLRNTITRSDVDADDWERIWVDTKVALIDAFHIVLKQLIEDMAAAKERALGIEAERTFGIVFALLDLPSTSSGPSAESSVPPTPFLNRSLLADYQQSYSLSRTLSSALRNAEEKDARLDVLESALAALNPGDTPDSKDPGALKLILRSYGMRQGIDNLGTRSKRQQSTFGTNSSTNNALPTPSVSTTPPVVSTNLSKGKGKAFAPVDDPELNAKATQILDVLPDLSPEYVRLLLGSERYKGDLEQVLGALLEDRAPSEEVLIREIGQREGGHTVGGGGGYDLSKRRNVFDDEDLDLSKVKIGKANIETNILEDRSYIDQMKADILRRAEAIFEEEEEANADGGRYELSADQGSERVVFSPEDELEEAGVVKVKVTGDGEETDESDAEGEDNEEEGEKMTPEVILELAWIRDPKLFDRDVATRRSKGREQLKKDTGWANEQIEGWKIMLDRNPKMQENIKQRHEFSGNRVSLPVPGPSRGEQSGRGGRQGRGRGESGRGRGGRGGDGGRGGGGSRGGGGGRGGNTGGGDAGSTRERAFKDKHKASRANHNRKRGHDKKMARAGAGVPPSS